MARYTPTTFALFLVLAFTSLVQADEVRVATASNFVLPMKVLKAEFEKLHSIKVKTSFASSGKLYTQIKHGASFDVFLSADQSKPALLAEEGIGQEASIFTYAIGRLALWGNNFELGEVLLSRLQNSEYRRLALANPNLAPYGIAAIQTLATLNLEQTSKTKWVLGENISQAYQFVHSGNSELGFVSLSQVMSLPSQQGKQFFWTVPHEHHEEIRQDAILLKRAQQSKQAKRFMEYLTSESASKHIQRFGYGLHH